MLTFIREQTGFDFCSERIHPKFFLKRLNGSSPRDTPIDRAGAWLAVELLVAKTLAYW
jgi:hypothetical protein